jgi:hypothetical protein
MSKLLLLLAGFFSLNSQAQIYGTVLDALGESQESVTVANVTVADPNTITAGQSMTSNAQCGSVDQKSLPLNFVMKLLRGKGATLTPTHNSATGKLNIFGGPMIANCNSMIDYQFHSAGNGMPHSFETRISAPCLEDKCEYAVQVVNGDKVTTETMKFSPDMSGFVACLKASGVFNDGKIVKNKLFLADFDADESGVTTSGKLVFVSQGPAYGNMPKVFSTKNLHKNDDCYFYEDIQKDGVELYSQNDIEKQSLINQAHALCNGADYQEIYQNLNSFTSIAGTYQQLEEIMKKDLLDKMKKAKKEFDKAVAKGDLSKLDTKKYADLFDAYHKLIVEKHLDASSHNDADRANPNLLVNLEKKLAAAQSDEEKEQIEKKIRDIASELSTYSQKPYFTKSDFGKFLSLQKKAPIKDPLWKKASLKMHKSVMSLNAVCQAYSVDNSSCKFSSEIEDMMEVEDLNDVIVVFTDKAKTAYQKRETVLKNPDENNSDFYASKVRECEGLYAKRQKGTLEWRQIGPRAAQSVSSQCRRKNPYAAQYGGRYMKKYQSCVESEMATIKARYTVSDTQIEVCNKNVDQYKKRYSEWAKLEKYRDDYYSEGRDRTTRTNNTRGTVLADENVSIPPFQPPYQPPMNPQYNQFMQPQMNSYNGFNQGQYSQMNPNQYSLGPSAGFNSGFNNGFNSGYNNGFTNNGYNSSFNSGYSNNGFNSGFNNGFTNNGFNSGMNFNFGAGAGFNNYGPSRYPSYSPGQNYNGFNQNYPAGMNGFMNNQTSPASGSYNFLNYR